ncbi:hypothetical protein [Paradevosia shaoguanensis]|uniref:Nucleoid-associated protein n=1 Tax=Paradevosia shaoguanensis TaxID=1335043 RepID=A0AA41UCI5_9HYPH|nr:hypothetical protein [Paradevosia shaoguanensis]MCF1744185.1 hypothetical protein [Paradevosia shaoguanensis]MCI0128668.1 hypothetical protein [Paradevosia shaoguanensis]
MPIESIHTYLVHPNKGVAEPAAIVGSQVPHEGEMFSLLRSVYEKADTECNIGIVFNKGSDGSQANVRRDMLTAYAGAPSVDLGRSLAEELGLVTTRRSGLGLLFLIKGKEGDVHKVVISRFRANNGVVVNEAADMLTVEFIDRVFMKNAHSYKAVVYRHQSLHGGFWTGMAVDKQINSQDLETSDYWMKDFLLSDFMTNPAFGTRRLAVALKRAIKATDNLEIKRQITAAATLAGGLGNETISVEGFCTRYAFTDEARVAVITQLERSDLAGDSFKFDVQEFVKQLPYRTVELDNGAMLTAEAAAFNKVFQHEPANGEQTQFTTVGAIVSEKLEKSR